MKKFITLIAAIVMIATMLTGCGVDAPTADDMFKKYDTETSVSGDADEKETADDKKDAEEKSDDKDADKKDETKSDTADKKENADKTAETDKAADTTTDKAANSNASNASTGNSNASQTSGSNSSTGSSNASQSKPVVSQETKPAEPAQPAHTHSYTATVTANPTCGSAGVKTYTCSCGSSYTESIPATGHNFVAQYEDRTKEIWHEGEVQYKYACVCGMIFDTNEEWSTHNFEKALAGEVNGHSFGPYEIKGQGWTEYVTEQVCTGNKCTTCGAWQ